MFIDITQFMRPNGRQVKGSLKVSDEFLPMVTQMKSLDLHFTCEQTMALEPVTYITHERYGDYDIEIGNPGEMATGHLDRLLERWDILKASKWLDARKKEEGE